MKIESPRLHVAGKPTVACMKIMSSNAWDSFLRDFEKLKLENEELIQRIAGLEEQVESETTST